ncbi:nucleotidyltransferase domain-containing protein [Nocardioides sp. YIM B13467]|uniref:nucleotidyltransferase domain-containing protein n=1 Tax=Nocardioides sp. YIM B13467 TaxID=3366294 RepID=UPI003673416E
MDFSAPYRVLTPTLDGPVLNALAGVDRWMTRTQILNQVEDASEAGIRKTLTRLVEQGIVIEERVGSRYTYSANRSHLLWPSIDAMFNARRTFAARVEEITSDWEIPPVSVELFGSVAQGTSNTASDIDLLVVRRELDDEESDVWDRQIESLHDHVVQMTGNACDILILDTTEFAEALARNDPVATSKTNAISGVRSVDIPALRDASAAARQAAVSAQSARLAASFSRLLGDQAEFKRLADRIVQESGLPETTRSALAAQAAQIRNAISPETERKLARMQREVAKMGDV